MQDDRLPKEIISKTSGKKIAGLIFLTAVFLILLNEIAYFYLKNNTPNLAYRIIAKKWEMLENMKEKKDWLILGDSTCNQGVSASIFEEKFSASVVNLCAIGGMLVVNDSWILEAYIKKFGPPKNILIVHTYDLWQRQRENVNLGLTSQLPLISLIREKPKPWVFNKKDEISLFLYKYCPLFYQKESLSETISILFKKGSLRNFANQRIFDEKGFMPMENANPKAVLEEVAGQKKAYVNSKFYLSEDNLSGLENIKKLAEKYGFNVFIANSPVCNELYKDESFKLYFGEIGKYLENYANLSDKIFYIDEVFAFSENEMVSADHIIARAAAEYSNRLSENIKKVIATN